MTDNEQYPIPAIAILSRWDYQAGCPVVYPSKRVGGKPVVHLTALDLELELADLARLQENAAMTGNPVLRVDVVAPVDAQAFMDARAEELVALAREADAAVAGDLYSYGFTDEQLKRMGLPVRPQEETL